MRDWYSINCKSDNGKTQADVYIYEEIGDWWGISANRFRQEFNAIPEDAEITVRINSPGGSVFDGLAIYSTIARRRENVVTRVEGWAASIASIIALAGRKTSIAENGFMMIHNPWGVAVGESEDMQKMADVLSKLRGGLVATYRAKTRKGDDEIMEAMDAETWFNAQEAKDWGLVDEIDDIIAVSASASSLEALANFANAPVQRIRAALERKKMEPPKVDSKEKSKGAVMRAVETIKDFLLMSEPKKPDAAAAPITAGQPTLEELLAALSALSTSVGDLKQLFAERDATVDAEIKAMRSELIAHAGAVQANVERQAAAKARSDLAALGIRGTSPPSGGSNSAESAKQTYQRLKGSEKTKFWRENRQAIIDAN